MDGLTEVSQVLGEAGEALANADIGAAGEVIADVAAGTAAAAVEGLVPQDLLEVLDTFFHTPLGGVAWRALTVLLILLAAMLVRRVVDGMFRRTIRKMREAHNPNAAVMMFLRYIALGAVYFTAFSAVVSAIPALNSVLTTLLATGGVLALVLGFAAQESLGAVASGLMILFFKPFIIGDILHVVSIGVTGTVEDITLRHTVLKTIENKRVIIPNSTMNGSVVENFDYGEKQVCLMLDVNITYESDTERALALLAEVVGNHPDYLDPRTPAQKAAEEPRVTVRVQELASSAVVLRALLWGQDNPTAFAMRCDLLRSVKARFDAEGIAFASPRVAVTRPDCK